MIDATADTALAQLQRTFVNTGHTNERRAALYWAAQRVGEMRQALAARQRVCTCGHARDDHAANGDGTCIVRLSDRYDCPCLEFSAATKEPRP